MTKEFELLLFLVRLGIGKTPTSSIDVSDINWTALIDSSETQGVSAIALDGLSKLLESNHAVDEYICDELKYHWYGLCLSYESNYASYQTALYRLISFFSARNIRTLLLKGYGLSLNYPIPSHRPLGDIDIYHFGLWENADRLVEIELGISVNRSHKHHTFYFYDGYLVENHYDFINTQAHKDAREIDELLKRMAADAIAYEFEGNTIYMPTPTFNVLFLLRHTGQHFAAERITLRQLLDWCLYIDKYSKHVDWSYIIPIIKKMGLWRLFCALNGICVDYLGITSSLFPGFDRDPSLEKRVLEDILQPEFSICANCAFVRLKRWFANIWKHKIVYNEPLLPMFIRLAWSHLVRARPK